MMLMYAGIDVRNQCDLVFRAGDKDERTKLLHQQIDGFAVHRPGIGAAKPSICWWSSLVRSSLSPARKTRSHWFLTSMPAYMSIIARQCCHWQVNFRFPPL